MLIKKLSILLVLIQPIVSYANAGCYGHFVNPITDICWECLLPLTIGRANLVKSSLPDTKNPKHAICYCVKNKTHWPGLSLGFWEPARLIDITRKPFCFVNLGGLQLNFGKKTAMAMQNTSSGAGNHHSNYHVHWYQYPVLYWLKLLTDSACAEKHEFDISYLSELDPTWNDTELSFILHPESALSATTKMQSICVAACLAASKGLANDKLYWCGGCQGSMYPISGIVQNHISGIQASLLLMQRMAYKLHQVGMLLVTAGSKALCNPYRQYFLPSSQYRYQMVNPKLSKCFPFGRSSLFWESGKQFPIRGEDFGYVVWRKRNCCVF